MHRRSHSFLENIHNKSLELTVPEMDPQGQVPLIFTALDESWSDVSGFFLRRCGGGSVGRETGENN